MTGPDKIWLDPEWANTFTAQTDPMQQAFHRTAAHPVTVEVLQFAIAVIEVNEACLKAWNGSGGVLDSNKAIRDLSAVIAQIEEMK